MRFQIVIRSPEDFVKAARILGRVKKGLPNWTSETQMRIGKLLERDLKSSAIQSGITSNTGTLLGKGIEYRQKPRGRVGRLFIREYGVMLDGMKAHWVNVTRSRSTLLAWASRAKSAVIRSKAKSVLNRKLNVFSIFVRPHPFINNGIKRWEPKVAPIWRQIVAMRLASAIRG